MPEHWKPEIWLRWLRKRSKKDTKNKKCRPIKTKTSNTGVSYQVYRNLQDLASGPEETKKQNAAQKKKIKRTSESSRSRFRPQGSKETKKQKATEKKRILSIEDIGIFKISLRCLNEAKK